MTTLRRGIVARRLVAVLACLAAASVVWPPRAGALPILEREDAIELANLLAEAAEEQDICYGWEVDVVDDDGRLSGLDMGSSNGPNVDARQGECTRYVVFIADIQYASEMSERSDRASFGIDSNVSGAPTETDLRNLGISGERLLSNNDDLVVIEAVSALPMLVAEKGIAPPVPLEANVDALPAADRPTNTPGSDWLRNYGAALAIGVVLIVAGVSWAVIAIFRPRLYADAQEALSDE